MGAAGQPLQGLKITPKYVEWNAAGTGVNRTLSRITQVELIGDGAGDAVKNLRNHGLDLGIRLDHEPSRFGFALLPATDPTPTVPDPTSSTTDPFKILHENTALSQELQTLFKQPGARWYGYRIHDKDLPQDPGVPEHLFMLLVLKGFKPNLNLNNPNHPNHFRRDMYVIPTIAKLPGAGWTVHYALGVSVLTIGRGVQKPGNVQWSVEDFDVSVCGVRANP